jgi:quinoprotein glucose dehydrogenase
LTVLRNGKPLDIVVQAAKSGFIFAFVRVTGEPLWPIEERPVPKSTMPGNPAWPTQPFPTVIEPFARQSFTEKDLNPDLSVEERAAITSQLRAARNEGLFTPPGTEETVQMPGNHGGVNWGLTAGDPVKGRFYVASYDLPAMLKLEESEAISGQLFTSPQQKGGALYRANCRVCHQDNLEGTPPAIPPLKGVVERLTMDTTRQVIHAGRNTMPPFAGVLSAADIDAIVAYLEHPVAEPVRPTPGNNTSATGEHGVAAATPPASPDKSNDSRRYYSSYGFLLSKAGDPAIAPPWMTLSAYDMNTGKRLWQAPVGSALGYEGKQTGVSRNKGGVVVTAGGLVLATTSEDRMLHAWDSDTGKLIWQYELPSVPQGVPAVYSVGGRQYIVVPAAYYSKVSILYPRGFGPKPAKNSYVALALPLKSKSAK